MFFKKLNIYTNHISINDVYLFINNTKIKNKVFKNIFLNNSNKNKNKVF